MKQILTGQNKILLDLNNKKIQNYFWIFLLFSIILFSTIFLIFSRISGYLLVSSFIEKSNITIKAVSFSALTEAFLFLLFHEYNAISQTNSQSVIVHKIQESLYASKNHDLIIYILVASSHSLKSNSQAFKILS